MAKGTKIGNGTGCLYIDFTFGICRYQIGILGFLLENFRFVQDLVLFPMFRRSSSMKRPLMTFGYIFCESPDASIMKHVGQIISDEIQSILPTAKISALISDKEECLKYIRTVSILQVTCCCIARVMLFHGANGYYVPYI